MLQKFGTMMDKIMRDQKHKYITYDIYVWAETWNKGFEVNLSIKCEQRRHGLQPPSSSSHYSASRWPNSQFLPTGARYKDTTPATSQPGNKHPHFFENRYLPKKMNNTKYCHVNLTLRDSQVMDHLLRGQLGDTATVPGLGPVSYQAL